MTYKKLPDNWIRRCPACGDVRDGGEFDRSGLCKICYREQQEIAAKLPQVCIMCLEEKLPRDFPANAKHCKACAEFLTVHTCEVCLKDYQRPEMVLENRVCIYCAFTRGSEQDLIALRSLIRSDRAAAIKLRELINNIPEKLPT